MRPIHAGLLLVAFALMIATNWAQQLYYLRTVNRLAASERRPGRMLVSGRSSGRLRGAVALLIVRQDDDVIERALVMEGSTVFARFRERPEWTGPIDTAPAGEASKPARTAIRNAVEHYRRISSGEAPQPTTRAAAVGGFVQRYQRLTRGQAARPGADGPATTTQATEATEATEAAEATEPAPAPASGAEPAGRTARRGKPPARSDRSRG